MDQLNIGWWFLILLGGITIFAFFGQTFIKIIKWGWYAALKIAIGAIILFLFNLLGQFIYIHVPLNIITAFVVGFLGIPGLITLVIVKWFFI